MELSVRRVVGYVPVTVVGVAVVSGVLAANGVRFDEVFRVGGLATLFNPFTYTVNMLFHSDWGHYAGNMWLWIPIGFVCTWLTSNRHVLLLVVTVNVLTSVAAIAVLQAGVGMSAVVLGVGAAVLVRATGMALQNASLETVQTVVAGLMTPLATGFLLVMILAGPRQIGDFAHFLGFLFGGAIEAIYVFSEHDTDSGGDERRVPKHVGR